MSDVGERLTRVAVAPATSAIAKRQNIATELQSVSSLIEEMLTMAKRSYSAALTASHMGHLAYEHNITIVQLRRRIDDLQSERSPFVGLAILTGLNCSHDSRRREHRLSKNQ